MKKVLCISATKGTNLTLAQRVSEVMNNSSIETEVINLSDMLLPLFTPEALAQGAPEIVLELTQKIKNADGLFISGPEYNGGAAPVLTNLIAWISTSGGKDWREAFNLKPVMLGSHSGGGGVRYLNTFLIQLNYIGAQVMTRQLLETGKNQLPEKEIQETVMMFQTLLK